MARKMKDSGIEWIGEIPEGWKVIKAKYGIEVTHGCDPKTEGSIPVYGSGTESFKSCGEYKEGPAVLVGRKGTLTIPHYINGKYWNVDTAFDIKTKSNFHLRYYYYLATIFDYQFYISQTTLPSMTQGNYYNMFLPFPLLSEQQELAAYLDTECSCIDALLTKARASIEEYKKLKQAVITQAVTKGVRGKREMKDSGVEWIGTYPRNWKIIKIKWLLHERKNRSVTGLEEPLSMSQKKGLIPTKDMDSIPNMASSFIGAKLVYKGDLVFNKLKAHLGVFSVSKYNGLVSPDYAVYYSTGLSNLNFLKLLFKTPRYISEFKKKSSGVGAGLTRLYSGDLYSIYCALPPLVEQKEIADYLDAKCAEIDRLIAKKEQLVKELESYKKSLIYEVVTGKREV